MELRIDPEFESKIPPLTADELQKLEENILADGMVISPIITWDGVIVDGHNRFRIIEKHPQILYTTHEMHFDDRFAAIAWICKNQLGRRNLTPEQKKYLIGKQYEAEKASYGASDGFRGNQYSDLVSGQNVHLPNYQKTSERIAAENGVNERYVRRAEQFAKGLDLANEIDPTIRSDVLSGALEVTGQRVIDVLKAEPEERPARVAVLRNPPKKPKRITASDKPLTQLQQISEDMLTAHGRATQDDMLYELEDAMESFTFRWTMCLTNNAEYLADEECRTQIHQLVQTGLDYLRQIIKGEIPK